MKTEHNIVLYTYSTMRTHSIGTVMYTPESIDELEILAKQLHGDFHLLGGGSNVVFASRVETPIINLMELDKRLVLNPDGTVTAGCSVKIQQLIRFGCDNGLGGFEYLYSLPASVGGVVYMNAGRGKGCNQSISDWIESVEYFDSTDLKVKKMNMDKSQWTYRCSPFHKMNAVILSATFNMQHSTKEEVNSRIEQRKNIVKTTQEGNAPSCGSVFNWNNRFIMWLLRGKRIGGACYSRKTNNWISNDRGGTANDVIKLIRIAKIMHLLTFQKCSLEIKIFN